MGRLSYSLGSSSSNSYGVMSPFKRTDSETMLHNRITELKAIRNRLQHLVEEAKSRREQIAADVEQWVIRAEKVIVEAEDITNDYKMQRGNTGCFCFITMLPTFMTKERKIRKRAAEKASNIVALLNSCNFDRISSS